MEQSLLKIVKRWRRYELRGNWSGILPKTRGFYVLYKKRPKAAEEKFDVVYIGVAGLGKGVRRGIKGRLKRHHNKKEGWTHYSFFEVHDNVTREDIREIESLLLSIFRHDSRVRLQNIQKSSRILYKLRQPKMWPVSEAQPRAAASRSNARSKCARAKIIAASIQFQMYCHSVDCGTASQTR